MSDWFYQLPVAWMTLVVCALTYGVTFITWWVVMALAARNRAAAFARVAAGMLSPLGTIFGLLVGFLAVQVWNDSQRAHEAVLREAGALRTAVILASNLSRGDEARIDDAIARHIDESVTHEWPAMADQRVSIAAVPPALTEALRVALAEVPTTEAQVTSNRELVRALEDALDARRQRILISKSSINWVKWSTLAVQALLLLITLAMIHCEHRDTAAIAMGIFATAVAASALLIAAHARPFAGDISVSPEILSNVKPAIAERPDP